MSFQVKLLSSQSTHATHAEAAFSRLHADILSGTLRPGDRMHIVRLQKVYQVGATPLREALSKLTSLDLVTAQGQRGFRVAPVSVENLIDVTRMRATLEIAALRLALASGDRDWEATIVAAEHKLRGCPKLDGKRIAEQWYVCNRAFHDALVAAAKSQQLMAFRSKIHDFSDRYQRLAGQAGFPGRDIDVEHSEIMQRALKRDVKGIAVLIVEHFVTTAHDILSRNLSKPKEARKIADELRATIYLAAGLKPISPVARGVARKSA
jgi:GntR family transcriptional regulator, carbon starvation induced regulator